MNYYDELGLRREATLPEIRQAYRLAARLVHPDGHVDEQVRAMAERQMKRLNEILTTLTDPQTRYEYDLTLDRASRLPVACHGAANLARQFDNPAKLTLQSEPWRAPQWAQSGAWFWLSLSMVILCAGLWYLSDGMPGAAVTMAQTERPAPADTAPARPKKQPAPGPVAAPAPRNDPKLAVKPAATEPAEEPQVLQVIDAPQRETTPPLEEAVGAPTLAAKPDPGPSPASHPPARAASFAGTWLYLPGSDKPAPGTYPATYVELLVAENNGDLSGSYRAKYKVPDLAISPDVSFRIRGKLPPDRTARLTWSSPDGARGEVEMTLLTTNLMNLTWWTTELGRRAALGSGTTKLIRQEQP